MQFVDANWQDAAAWNAQHGFPWAVWGRRSDVDMPLTLMCSKPTKAEAEGYITRHKDSLRPKGQWSLIVVDEA